MAGSKQSLERGRAETKESYIRLDDFLKFSGRVRSGGEAKHRIQAGEVSVNGVVETHRSRKLNEGDKVLVDGVTVAVTF